MQKQDKKYKLENIIRFSRLSVCVFLFFAFGCEPRRPLQYYRQGISQQHLDGDLISCGANNLLGEPTYFDKDLPRMDACMRSKGYKVDIAHGVDWTRPNTTPDQEKVDFFDCGGFRNFFTNEFMIHEGTLPEVDKCMRSKGYSTAMAQ